MAGPSCDPGGDQVIAGDLQADVSPQLDVVIEPVGAPRPRQGEVDGRGPAHRVHRLRRARRPRPDQSRTSRPRPSGGREHRVPPVDHVCPGGPVEHLANAADQGGGAVGERNKAPLVEQDEPGPGVVLRGQLRSSATTRSRETVPRSVARRSRRVSGSTSRPRRAAYRAPRRARVGSSTNEPVVEDPQPSGPQVVEAAVRVDDLAGLGQRHRERVDGEIAPAQVLGEGRRAHLGQRPGARVGLRSRPGDVDRAGRQVNRRGLEAVVDAGASPPSASISLAASPVDDQVEVAHGPSQQGVADGSADQVGVRPGALGGGADRGETGQRDDPLAEALGVYLALARHGQSSGRPRMASLP